MKNIKNRKVDDEFSKLRADAEKTLKEGQQSLGFLNKETHALFQKLMSHHNSRLFSERK
ncbi:MAG: hypothetical protein ACOH2A_11765 [Sphingobacteriaceae bacterium]